ncbi:MAG TPA: biosynthetic peptidoglycan transglycosylase [Gaiellaceae bacterium]|nr:biosynthetic peptidoglycan transglycosylase [Gaiellaceae bacterium]
MAARPFRRLLLPGVLLVVAALAGVFAVALLRAPSVADLPARLTSIERANGADPVPITRIPATLREAVVATEDERFYDNRGVDVIALARAVPYDVVHLSLAQGASTITEQLGKLAYLQGNDHSPWRKLTDIALGFRIGHHYDHEQVLDDYLNVAYFGDGAYGVESAAHRYFGRDVSRLDLAQASLLAGLVQAPTAYDPLTDPRGARDRQVAVLRSMVRNGYVTEAQAGAAVGSRLPLAGGRALPALHGIDFAVPAPFDWAELAVALLLVAGAAAAFVAARVVAPSLAVRSTLRVAAVLLLLAGALTAAYSVQVV